MDKLSDELVLNILSHLETDSVHSGHTVFRAVAQVSKQFNRIATPLLYLDCRLGGLAPARAIQIHGIDEQTWSVPLPSDRYFSALARQALQLADTALTRPPLGRLVQILTLPYVLPMPPAGTTPLFPPFPDEVVAADAHDGPSFGRDLWVASHRGSSDAIFAMLLLHMTELRHLNFHLCRQVYFDRTLLMRAVECAVLRTGTTDGQGPYLSKLRSVSISNTIDQAQGWHCHRPVQTVSFFLQLPSLQTLWTQGCASFDRDFSWACDEGVSNVKSIHLHGSHLNSTAFSRILRSCGALRELCCTQECRACVRIDDGIDYDDITGALSSQRDTLETLMLNLGTCGCGGGMTIPNYPMDPHRLESLQEFHHLIRLEVHTTAFYETSNTLLAQNFTFQATLPANLKYLILHCPHPMECEGEYLGNLIPVIADLFSARAAMEDVSVVNSILPDEDTLRSIQIKYHDLLIVEDFMMRGGPSVVVCKRAAIASGAIGMDADTSGMSAVHCRR